MLAACLVLVPAVVAAEDGEQADQEAAVEDLETDDPETDVEPDDPEVDEPEAAEAADEEAGDDEEPPRDWSVGGGLTMMVAQGTFVRPANDTEYADEVQDGSGAFNRVSMNFSVNAGYQFDEYSMDIGVGYNQFLTPGGGGTEPYEGRLQDTQIGVARKGWEIAETGIEVEPSLGIDLPTSTSSRTMTLLTSLSASASLSRTFFGSLSLGYSLGLSRNFHRYTSPVLDEDEIQDEEFRSPLYRPDGTEDLGAGRFAISGINNQWGMSHGINAAMIISPEFQLMANYSISTGWTYPVVDEEDEFAHDRQCVGRCPSQFSSGGIMANYMLSDSISLTGGLTTSQRPKTADNKTFAFPFWDFTREASNRSRMTIGVSGSY